MLRGHFVRTRNTASCRRKVFCPWLPPEVARSLNSARHHAKQTHWKRSRRAKSYVLTGYDASGQPFSRFFTQLERRLYAQDRPVLVVDEHVEQSVRALPDIAHTVSPVRQQGLAAELLHLFVEQNSLDLARADDLAGAQAADEEVAFPLWQRFAGIE